MALLALALGVASSLVLVSPLLVVVPLAGVVTAVIAIRSIRASDGQLLGYWPATFGLCLAVLFVGWGFSRQWTRQNMLTDHSRQFVAGWLRICQEGKLQRADQFMRSPGARIHSDEELAAFYKTNQDAGEEIESFFAQEPMRTFLAVGKQSRSELSIVGQTHSGFTDEIIFRCDYWTVADNARAGNEPALRHFWVSVVRDDAPGSIAPSWRISNVDAAEPLSVRRQ